MVIHHTDGLHKGVTNSWANKLEPSRFERLAHSYRLYGFCGDLTKGMPLVDDWFAANKIPSVGMLLR